MAYVAVKGGKDAIEESMQRVHYERIKQGTTLDCQNIKYGMRFMVDQVMSEASLYAPDIASLAIKQGEGSLEEAVFLMRAYRSTLPRKYYSTIIESSTMEVERRISAAFKDIPNGQILGTSHDYIHRLLDKRLMKEKEEELQKEIDTFLQEESTQCERTHLRMEKVSEYLRREGILPTLAPKNEEPVDITKEMLTFPTTRSARLQTLTRGMTQALTALGYASLRGYGSVHPTVGELRVGTLPITVADPMSALEEDAYYVGEIKVSEVENLIPVTIRNAQGEKELEFKIGYGIAFGQNETKAIAMSILDQCLESEEKSHAVNDEEFVLYHIDAIEATGFISHLKLPHYVTFQSKLQSIRKTKKEKKNERDV